MKKLICMLLALCCILSLTACGSYTEGSTASRDSVVILPPEDIDPNAENLSVVTMTLNGRSIVENPGFYELFLELDIYAQWSNGYTTVISQFDEQGVARATGLDGDYSVTVLAKRKGEELDTKAGFTQTIGDYTYNINGHTTTNDNREIELPMYRILAGDGPGSDWMYPYVKEFSDQGVYAITLNSPEEVVMCRFAPEFSGIYTIESWVSVADDNVNPQYDYWYGSVAWAAYGYTIDDGGAEGAFTKNFKDVRTVTDEEIGNVFIFGIHASAKEQSQYPLTVYISVLKTGEMGDRYEEIHMVPTDLHYAQDGEGEFVNYWQPQAGGTQLLDDDKCRLWAVEDGGDGFYHIYDETEYASTGGWGPTLYAQIAPGVDEEDREYLFGVFDILDYSLRDIEWMGQGNKMLSLSVGNVYYRYKQFIEGFQSLSSIHSGWGGSNYCVNDCPCHAGEADPVWACEEYCETCSLNCTQCPPELYGAPGYADAVNTDGLYPVTEELKVFLQLYAECHNLFCDGTGDLEKKGLNSNQDSMWLWAVGYYTGDRGGKCEMGGLVPYDFG